MGFMDWLQDEDNDGSRLDDGARAAANIAGAGLTGVGAFVGGLGGFVAAGGGATTATGVGAPVGIPAAGVGLLTMGAGATMVAAGQFLGSSSGQAMAEEVGDFHADSWGTRGAPPNADQPITDPHYAAGRTDGFGQRANRGMHRVTRELAEFLEEHPVPRPTMGNPTPPMPGISD